MSIFTRILCPVDLSDHSRHALDVAVALGRRYGASVTALFVIPLSPLPAGIEAPAYIHTPEDLAVIERTLRSFVDDVHADIRVNTLIMQGYVAGSIVDTAAASKADLIVVGTHGRSGFQRVILGSVAERVLAHASCPVMTVPPRAERAPSAQGIFGNVLCAVDYSPSSMKALELATALARDANAVLTVAHVVEPASAFEPVMAGEAADPFEYQRTLVTAARARLHEAIPADLGARGQARELVLTGKPYPAILQLAREQRSELMILGAHGGLASILGLGSTTNHIVRTAPCPVISVRA